MPRTPQLMLISPPTPDGPSDVVSDVLGAVRLEARVFGRFELGAPWALRVPAGAGHLSFYVLARGGAWVELDGRPDGRPDGPIALSAGDVVLLPHGAGHELRDPGRGAREVHTLSAGDCPRPTTSTPMRLGGSGPMTVFVAGAFRFGATGPSVLLDSLPPVLHMPAGDARMSPQLAATAQLILTESAAPGPGSSILSARLAEILLIHALRARVTTTESDHAPGLCALADPAIGAALRLIHGRPAEAWTVERLAREVALSRSAFAARFTELVGVPPLQYLTQWRMTEAAQRLREGEQSVARIAEQVGYANPVAFSKAFARVHGVGPGTYRRAARRPPSSTAP
jgi:AraC-like DNA-binding protein